jgi:hypothetical protein
MTTMQIGRALVDVGASDSAAGVAHIARAGVRAQRVGTGGRGGASGGGQATLIDV